MSVFYDTAINNAVSVELSVNLLRKLSTTRSKVPYVIMGIILLLVAIRLAMPPVGKWYINKTLKNGVAGYFGQIDDLSLTLMLGSYTIDGLVLRKAESLDKIRVDQPPYLVISSMNFRVFWKPLLKGNLRGKVDINNATVNLVHDPASEYTQTGAEGGGKGWLPTADALFPLTIEEVRIHNSQVRFLNPAAKPPIDLSINRIEMIAENITNGLEHDKKLPTSLDLTAIVPNSGNIKLFSEFNLNQEPMPFNLDANLVLDNLELLNPFFSYYMNFDVADGKLSLSTEAAGNDNCLKGYVKPVFENLDFRDTGEKYSSVSNFFIEQALALANFIVRFYPKDRTATKVEFEKHYDNFSVETWKTITGFFRNAFVQAYNPKIDHQLEVDDASTGCMTKKKEG